MCLTGSEKGGSVGKTQKVWTMLMQAKSEVGCCLCRVWYPVCLIVSEKGGSVGKTQKVWTMLIQAKSQVRCHFATEIPMLGLASGECDRAEGGSQGYRQNHESQEGLDHADASQV